MLSGLRGTPFDCGIRLALRLPLVDIRRFGNHLEDPMIEVNAQPKIDEANVGLASHKEEVCTELFTKYNRKIFNTAYRILGEESSAEDALQETLLNVYRGLGSFRGEAKISTWISRITVNVCLGMLRKGKQKQFVDIDEDTALELPAEITVGNNPLLYVSGEEVRAAIEETFRRMSERQIGRASCRERV